jgi:hypothetical protein
MRLNLKNKPKQKGLEHGLRGSMHTPVPPNKTKFRGTFQGGETSRKELQGAFQSAEHRVCLLCEQSSFCTLLF